MKHEEQLKPVKNNHDPVWELVVEDMKKRDHVGRQRYGTPLQPFNGRDALRDAYEEALDLAVYLRQVVEERQAFTDYLNGYIDDLNYHGKITEASAVLVCKEVFMSLHASYFPNDKVCRTCRKKIGEFFVEYQDYAFCSEDCCDIFCDRFN